MIFKNKRAEVPSYVIGLIIAIIILLVAVGAIIKIKTAQGGSDQPVTKSCEQLAGGTCTDATAGCPTGKSQLFAGFCPTGQICCSK